LTKRIRNLGQICKEDYGVEPEAAQRLKCNLASEFGIDASGAELLD
jgi:hypothetical protein